MQTELNKLNELNENEMSLSNMPAIFVPMPPPLVRQMCYLPEHYHPFIAHSDEPSCLCSFCNHKRFSESVQELKEAVKEVPQIVALEESKRIEELTRDLLEKLKAVTPMNEPLRNSETELWAELGNPVLEPINWVDYDLEEEILLQPEEEILLQPTTRSLQDFPIPTLSRSTNDPITWEDDEEILL